MQQARYSQRWWFAVLAIAAAGLLAAQRPVAAQQPASSERPTILGSPFQFPQLTYDCGSIDPALTVSLKVTRTECPMTPVWSPWFDTESIKGEGLLATFNSEGAVVAIHETAYGNTLSFSGTIDHTGHQDDTIFWGLWHRGRYNLTVGPDSPTGGGGSVLDDSNAVPYILGVDSRVVAANDRLRGRLHRLSSLPTEGVFNYTLLADTGIVSTKDHDLNFVPIGNVSDAHAAIDLKNGTGQLDLSVAVRGTTATIHMQLEPHNKILGISSGADSVGAPSSTAPCSAVPEATAEFYGRDGEFLGVRFSYLDCHVLPEPVWEAAKLGAVGSQGVVVLRRSGN